MLLANNYIRCRAAGYRGSAEPLSLSKILHASYKGFWAIMAPVVILGGLVTSTLLNLLILPALYARFRTKAGAFGTSAAGS